MRVISAQFSGHSPGEYYQCAWLILTYEPALQPNADFLKAKLGDKVRFERFDEDGHALFVDDPVKFNRVVEEFVQSLPKQ